MKTSAIVGTIGVGFRKFVLTGFPVPAGIQSGKIVISSSISSAMIPVHINSLLC